MSCKEVRWAARKSGELQGSPMRTGVLQGSPVCCKEVRCAARSAARKSGVLQGSPVGCKKIRCATKNSGERKEVWCAARKSGVLQVSPLCCKKVEWAARKSGVLQGSPVAAVSESIGQAPERGVGLPKGLAGRSFRVDKSAACALGSAPSGHMHKTQSLSIFVVVVSFLTQCPAPRLRVVVSFLWCSMLVWPCCWLIVAIISRLPLRLVFCFSIRWTEN